HLTVLELGLERGVALGRHRDLLHRSFTSAPSRAPLRPDLRQRAQAIRKAPPPAANGSPFEPATAKKVPIAGRCGLRDRGTLSLLVPPPACLISTVRPGRNSSAAHAPRDRPRDRL